MLSEIYETLSNHCDNDCDNCELGVEIRVDDERITLCDLGERTTICDLIDDLYNSEVFS